MAVEIMKKVEEIEPMDTGVRVRRGAPQYYKGKEKAEAQKPMVSGSSAFKRVELTSKEEAPKKFSERQVDRVLRVSEKNKDRANRILDRMKKRKNIEGSSINNQLLGETEK